MKMLRLVCAALMGGATLFFTPAIAADTSKQGLSPRVSSSDVLVGYWLPHPFRAADPIAFVKIHQASRLGVGGEWKMVRQAKTGDTFGTVETIGEVVRVGTQGAFVLYPYNSPNKPRAMQLNGDILTMYSCATPSTGCRSSALKRSAETQPGYWLGQ